jgi:hypothetical protein
MACQIGMEPGFQTTWKWPVLLAALEALQLQKRMDLKNQSNPVRNRPKKKPVLAILTYPGPGLWTSMR